MPYSSSSVDTRVKSVRFIVAASLISVLLAVVLAMIAIQVNRAIDNFLDANRWVMHTLEVKQQITLTVASLRDTEASQRAYVISGNPERLADYYGQLPFITEHVKRLRQLVVNNREQQKNVSRLSDLLTIRTDGMSHVLERYASGGFDAARDALRQNNSRGEDQTIQQIAVQMVDLEDELLAKRQEQTDAQAKLTRIMTLGAIALCFGLLGFALVIVLLEQRRRLAGEARVRAANAELLSSLDDARRLGHTLRQLSELGEMLQGCRSIDEAIHGVRLVMPQLLPGKSGTLAMINASQNLIEPIAHWGESAPREDILFGPDDCWALRRGHAHPPSSSTAVLICKHLLDDPTDQGSTKSLCIPMAAQGEMLGILSLSADQAFNESDRSVAQAAAEQLSLALANLRLQDTLRTQSLRDPLTGLFNRRYLEASLEREVLRAERRKLPLSVLMLDVDHFKRFNDANGHEAGDTLLSQFGALLARIVRSEDVACRYGGEEFTILLQETDAPQALARAEQICAAVRELEVLHRRQTLGPVTVSIGIATLNESVNSPDELLRVADRALYAAKHAGRDRALLAT